VKTRDLAVLALLVGLALLLILLGTLAAAAQGPEQPMNPQPMPFQDRDEAKSFSHPVAAGERGAQSVRAPTVDLGEPGLSFRYVKTLGESEVAYFDDAAHLNGPYGVGSDGTHVWIAECEGRRALKYSSDGSFVMQIGKAGFRYGTGTTLECLSDVATDSGGNVWIVDRGARHVIKYDASGSRASELGQAWGSGTGNDRFDDPYGIAFDSAGNIYVSDGGNHRIQVFDNAETYVTTIGVSGRGGFGQQPLQPSTPHRRGQQRPALRGRC